MTVRPENPYLLVVGDDDPSLAPGCLARMDIPDYPTTSVPTAAEAIALARQRRPSLILLNLRGREECGFEIWRMLAGAEWTRDIPILAIAGDPPLGQFMIALSVKPCDPVSLDREIHRLVDRRH